MDWEDLTESVGPVRRTRRTTWPRRRRTAGRPSGCACSDAPTAPRARWATACPSPHPGQNVPPSVSSGHKLNRWGPAGFVAATAASPTTQNRASFRPPCSARRMRVPTSHVGRCGSEWRRRVYIGGKIDGRSAGLLFRIHCAQCYRGGDSRSPQQGPHSDDRRASVTRKRSRCSFVMRSVRGSSHVTASACWRRSAGSCRRRGSVDSQCTPSAGRGKSQRVL